jgi:CheY-specific phosphatase CheX
MNWNAYWRLHMPEIEQLLDGVTEEVLEGMFFSAVMGETTGEVEGSCLSARVSFSGSRNGSLAVSAPNATAASLAGSFLGTEDGSAPEDQINAALGELANILCGAVLGRSEPAGRFAISTPQVSIVEHFDLATEGMQIRRSFELMDGNLAIGLTIV